MNIIFSTLIFCIVLFIYLHVYFHLKKSEDLELYEIDLPSKTKLEEICDFRQPVVFTFANTRLIESCARGAILDTYGAFDIKLRNVKDLAEEENDTTISELYIPLAFSSAIKVLKDDDQAQYLSENNGDFLEETGLNKVFAYNDEFLRPAMVSNCFYDLLLGATNCKTPLRYEVNYRNYFFITEGDVQLKLAPPKSTRYLAGIKDYENFEFRSPVNPWQVQPMYRADFDKVKCLEVTLTKGQIIFIPAYWWYSMHFLKETTLCAFKYRTYMNNVAILPQLAMRFLQRQNVKRNVVQNVVQNVVIQANNNNIKKTESNITDIV